MQLSTDFLSLCDFSSMVEATQPVARFHDSV